MPKVRVEEDELYPVYSITESIFAGNTEIELTQYELFKVNRVKQEFEHVQLMLANRVREARGTDGIR